MFHSVQSFRIQHNWTPETIASRSIKAKSKLLREKRSSSRVSIQKKGPESALSYRSRSVSDFPGARPCPATVETDWYTGCQRKKAELSSAAVWSSHTRFCKVRPEMCFNNKTAAYVCLRHRRKRGWKNSTDLFVSLVYLQNKFLWGSNFL